MAPADEPALRPDATAASGTIGSAATHGARWAGASATITYGLQLLQLVVLAHFLDPDDFGLMAMATVVAGLAALPSEAGIGVAIVQKKETSPAVFSSLYWLGLVLGGLLFAAIALLKTQVAWLYDEPRLEAIVVWAALPLVIAPLGQPFMRMLERGLEFRRLARIEMTAAIVATGLAIGSAAAGLGVYALIVGLVTGVSVKTAAYLVHGLGRWRVRLTFDRHGVAGHLRLGAFHLGQRLVNFVTVYTDQFLIGAVLGATQLGYYTMAVNLANLVSGRINLVVGRVCFPLLARLQDDVGEVKRVYLRVLELTTTVTFPVQLGMAVTATLFVPLLFGAEWTASGPILQIIALGGVARAAAGTVGPLLLALGRTELGFRWSLLVVGPQVLAIGLAVTSGQLVVIAITYAGMRWVYAGLSYRVLVRRLIGPCLGAYLRSMATALWFGTLMAAAVWLLDRALSPVPAGPRLALDVATGVLIYGGLVMLRRPALVADVRRLIGGTDGRTL